MTIQMSEAEEKVKNFIGNITQFVTLSEPQTYKNLTIIPLILKDDLLDFITIKEAEEAEAKAAAKNESYKVAVNAIMKEVSASPVPEVVAVESKLYNAIGEARANLKVT